MKRFFLIGMIELIGLILLISGSVNAQDSSESPKHLIPAGAVAAGYTKCLFDVTPTVEDISPDRKGCYSWYSGQWYFSEPPAMEKYTMENGVLAVRAGGDLVSAPPSFREKGKLPYLSGKDGFYVEFEVRLSDNDPDHFPAVWLMPTAKNQYQEDVYPGDPEKLERWMELDVDEGGFGPGITGTVHCGWGKYPNYHHLQNGNNVSRKPLDRSQIHTFGASYDPETRTVCWWLDDEFQMSATSPYVPQVAELQEFYLIISAQQHKEKKDYTMYVHSVRAYGPQEKTR